MKVAGTWNPMKAPLPAVAHESLGACIAPRRLRERRCRDQVASPSDATLWVPRDPKCALMVGGGT